MVGIDNILYLGFKDELGKPELLQWFSVDALKTYTKEYRQGISSTYQNISDPTDGRKVLIAYHSIPLATRIAKGMPTEEQLRQDLQKDTAKRIIQFSEEAYRFYLAHPTTAKRAKEIAEQASFLIAIAKPTPRELAALGFSKSPPAPEGGAATGITENFFTWAIGHGNEMKVERQWKSWKCNTINQLRKKLKPVQQALKGKLTWPQCFEALISKKHNNDNALKIELDQQALLVQLYSDANAKPTFEQVWMIYTRKAHDMISLGHWIAQTQEGSHKCLLSVSGIRAFLTKPSIMQLWYEARQGYQEYRNMFDPIISRQRATFANAMWVIDGTPIHRYYQGTTSDSPDGKKTGKYFRWNIFIVLDAHSECVIGFWISESEDTASVLGALRSACLVSGKMPHQILYDHGSAITSYRAQHALDAISVVNFPAQAGNARSKPVEGYFHWFNQHVEKFRIGYTANPFALTLNNRPNREALSLAVRQGKLTLAEHAIDQLIADFTIANNTPRPLHGGLSAMQVYRKSIAATASRQREFTDGVDVEAFWTEPGEQKKIRGYHEGKSTLVKTWVPQLYPFTNNGIDITINKANGEGKVWTYDVEDPAFRKVNIGQKFSVKYEPNESLWVDGRPEKLLLYINGSPVQWKGAHLAAVQKVLVPMAIADYGPGGRARLNERLDNKRNQREMVKAEFNQLLDHTKINGTYTQVITENAFDKEVIANTEADIRNQIIQGDSYRLCEALGRPEGGSKMTKIDRLSLGMDGPEDDEDKTN